MKVIVKKAGKKEFEKIEISGSLESLKEIVGGYIEVVPFAENILMICNEEGKLLELKPNFIYCGDVICGDVLFCSFEGEDFIGLNDYQLKFFEILNMKG